MILRQAAFSKGKSFLKGSLHMHTTRSDGKVTPEETIRIYHENGYDFLALTDHNILNHLHHGDAPMTILTGIERDFSLPGYKKHKPFSAHVVGIGVPGNPDTPEHDARPQWAGYGENPIEAQPMIDDMHRWGMLTFYAHPQWTGSTYQDFGVLKGNFAMEIWNSCFAMATGHDTNAAYWDEALDDGQIIYGVAVDDCHHTLHMCKGWVMVSSDNTPEAILEALKNGEFYSSCGPIIHDFYIEDGMAHVSCSEAESVCFYNLRHPMPRIWKPEGHVTHAACQVPEDLNYVRACVTDAQGRRAWTNPIFLR